MLVPGGAGTMLWSPRGGLAALDVERLVRILAGLATRGRVCVAVVVPPPTTTATKLHDVIMLPQNDLGQEHKVMP
eukprot:3825206-Prymnesium_polylepis.1